MRSLVLLLLLMVAAAQDGLAGALQQGEDLLKAHCSRCHAIGETGDSPHDEAPPFREVMKIYGAIALEEALAEGLVTGHPDMPEFVFLPKDVGSIIAYLQSLEPSP